MAKRVKVGKKRTTFGRHKGTGVKAPKTRTIRISGHTRSFAKAKLPKRTAAGRFKKR